MNESMVVTQEEMLPVGAPETPYRSVTISDIVPGQDDVVATFSVRIGGVLIRRASLRKGRGNATFVNYPSVKTESGKWIHLFEIVSPSLEAHVTKTIHQAISEATR